MLYITCLTSHPLQFKRLFLNNKNLHSPDLTIIPLMNKKMLPPGSIYNAFLKTLPQNARWVVFTSDSLSIWENPARAMQNLAEDSIYGIWGGSIAYNAAGQAFQEFRGKIVECASEQQPYELYNASPKSGETVLAEALDSRCLIVPAQLIRDHALRFDDKLQILYGEDLCLRAFDAYGIKSRILPLEVGLLGKVAYSREQITPDLRICAERYGKTAPRAGIHNIFGGAEPFSECLLIKKKTESAKVYRYGIDPSNYNTPSVLAAKILKQGSRVLDAGCATGYTGVFLKKTLQCAMHGWDYSAQSLEIAQASNAYETLRQIDLNNFIPSHFPENYRFFDSILLLDVLEHLYSPQQALKTLSLYLNQNGSFIISLPNLAHMYPVLGLMEKKFSYQNFGILDSTHIRFFTWKSIATSLASWGFRISKNYATFLAPNTSNSNAPVRTSLCAIETLLMDPHSLVCQYICQLSPSTESYASLKAHNLAKLEKSTDTNPEGRQAIEDNLQLFIHKVKLTHGKLLSQNEILEITQLMSTGNYAQAMTASGFFDEHWYREEYDEIDFSAISPLQHYLSQGWEEGKNPSEMFDSAWYQQIFGHLFTKNTCPLVYHLAQGVAREHPHSLTCLYAPDAELVRYAQHVLKQEGTHVKTFVALDENPYKRQEGDPRLIAFYLPQFYPFPENDRWWGKGFTEWTNVTKAIPQYVGHYQPHLPHDLGFYDLRVKETRHRQEELALHYGIHGFCYHYYWFDGKKVMNTPIEEKLIDDKARLPFCINWANEPWSANWDGSQNNLLIGQAPKIQTEKLFYDLLPFFKDERYICVNKKPFFMIYKPTYFGLLTVRKLITDFQNLAQKNGLPGLHVVVGKTPNNPLPFPSLEQYGADANIEFPPHLFTRIKNDAKIICNPKGNVHSTNLPKLIEIYKKETANKPAANYRTVLPSWDNSPRRAEKGSLVLEGASPAVYLDWLIWCIKKTAEQAQSPDNRLVFINGWNEWAEGAHLEPDKKYGYAFLKMTKMALYAARK